MRVVVINTGTEILLGDVLNTHLTFIAQAILPLRLRVERQLSVPDGAAIREALVENLPRADLIFVTGGLGPTTDDLTREITAELLARPLAPDPALATLISERLRTRGIRLTDRILRQAQVPAGAVVLPNDHGTAPGLVSRGRSGGRASCPAHFPSPRTAARVAADVYRVRSAAAAHDR